MQFGYCLIAPLPFFSIKKNEKERRKKRKSEREFSSTKQIEKLETKEIANNQPKFAKTISPAEYP